MRYPGTKCDARGVASSPIRQPAVFYKNMVVQGQAGQMVEPAELVSEP